MAEDPIHLRNHRLIQPGELRDVLDLHERLLVPLHRGEVPQRQPISARAGKKLPIQSVNQLHLLVSLPDEIRHLLPQVMNDERVHLDGSRSFHKLVDSTEHRAVAELRELLQQALLLSLQQLGVLGGPHRAIPEGPGVHSADLRRSQHLPEAPHERAIHSHELLPVDAVRLVQHDAHLVLLRLQNLQDLAQLVADVQLVGIEHDDHQVGALREPRQHLGEIILPAEPLLLAAENARRVDERDVGKQGSRAHVHFSACQFRQKGRAEGREPQERFLAVVRQSMPCPEEGRKAGRKEGRKEARKEGRKERKSIIKPFGLGSIRQRRLAFHGAGKDATIMRGAYLVRDCRDHFP
eukprot:scaffold7601_cov267-Pinguiococcus_pyrenoidosus.AAC.7